MTSSAVPSPDRPLLELVPGSPVPRVAVVSGSYGAGHDSAAREIARVLREVGCVVDVLDVVPMLPWGTGTLLRNVYYGQLRRRPETWGRTLRLLEPGRRLHQVASTLVRLIVPPVLEATRDVDLVIATHPLAAQALGQARVSGQLPTPVVTYLTDASVHALWVHAGVDLNLAIHPLAAAEARRWGGNTTAVRPLTPPHSAEPADCLADPFAGWEIIGPRALVTGGALGIGDLERTARDIVATGVMTPVVLCGADAGLRHRLSSIADVVALGWRDDVTRLLASSDCVVQNAGGFTSLEALASGTPVLTYRPLPGHGIANCTNLDAAGLVPWARDRDDLGRLLAEALDAPRINRLPTDAPDLTDVLCGVRAALAA